MTNIFKKYERIWFVFFLIVTVVCFGLSVVSFFFCASSTSKWIMTTGLFAIVAGLVQLEVSGLFDKIMEEYTNEEKYPSGPPSHITRQIIDNPDTPVRTFLRNICFFEARTGFWFIVIGTLLQVLAVWL